MIGELDYSTLLVDNLKAKNTKTLAPMVPYEETSFIFFFIFLLAMPIVLMNLLVSTCLLLLTVHLENGRRKDRNAY